MQTINDNNVSLQLLIAYGIFVVIYLVLLRFLIYVFQHMWDTGAQNRSVIDRDIHQTMRNNINTSMQALDTYGLAKIILRAGIAILAMVAIILILHSRFGLIITALLIGVAVLILWTFNYWSKNSRKTQSVRNEIRKYVSNIGGVGILIGLSVCLALLLFIMVGLK